MTKSRTTKDDTLNFEAKLTSVHVPTEQKIFQHKQIPIRILFYNLTLDFENLKLAMKKIATTPNVIAGIFKSS